MNIMYMKQDWINGRKVSHAMRRRGATVIMLNAYQLQEDRTKRGLLSWIEMCPTGKKNGLSAVTWSGGASL
jgi:hypothetical protein